MEKYTEEKLEKISIYSLRDILREEFYGTPALKKKSVLIAEILERQQNIENTMPEAGKKKKGRPRLARNEEQAFVFACPNVEGEGNAEDGDGFTVSDVHVKKPTEGIFRLISEDCGVLLDMSGKNQDIFVNKPIISRYSLRNGDYIEGKKEKTRSGAIELKEIEFVNGMGPDRTRKRLNFSLERAVYPDARISLAREGGEWRLVDMFSPIGKGQRAIIVLPEFADEIELADHIVKDVSDEGLITVTLLPESRPEDESYLRDREKGEVISSAFDKGGEEHVRAIELATDRACRIAEMGKNVVVVFISPKIDEIKENAVKKLFAASKNTKNCGSLTLITIAKAKSGLADKFSDYCNCLISFDENGYDFRSSYTRNAGLLLSADAVKAAASARKNLSREDIIAALEKTEDEAQLIYELTCL